MLGLCKWLILFLNNKVKLLLKGYKMKNFLIFLSIIVVTLLAVTDFKQRMAELDNISSETMIRNEIQEYVHTETDSSKLQSENSYKKVHK